MSANLSAIFYLVSGVLFILALRGLSSPETSRQGNFFGILGMVIAITVTFLSVGSFSTGLIYVLIFLLVGGLIGAFIAYKIPKKFPCLEVSGEDNPLSARINSIPEIR
jgi:NAD(P) transhydrogenase subunit beta